MLKDIISIAITISNSTFKRIKFVLRTFWNVDEFKTLNSLLSRKNLVYVKNKQPDIYRKPYRAYMLCSMSTDEKYKYILSHYDYICKIMLLDAIKNIYTTKDGENILTFNSSKMGNFDINLCYIHTLGKEGELTLLLSQNKEDIYSIQLTFFQTVSNGLEVLIGGIQGRGDISSDFIKRLTKDLHGVRPRNLLFFILRRICKVLDIETIKAVQTNEHISSCSHVNKTGKFKADYNIYWEEEDGIKIDSWYILPTQEKRKTIDEIKSKKRSMYRKRYEMLDSFKDEVDENLLNLLGEKIINNDSLV